MNMSIAKPGKNIFTPTLLFILSLWVFSIGANAQLINEILVNPDFNDSNCEYVEIKGTPLATLTNLYFVSVEGDGSGAGSFRQVVDLSAATIGESGLLVIKTDESGSCTRNYNSPATTLVQHANFSLQNGTNSWLLIQSPTVVLDTDDYDDDNNGTLELLPNDATILDDIAWFDGNNSSDIVYGTVLATINGGISGAATRFMENTTAQSLEAWYYGEMDGPVTSLTYDLNAVSSNFPAGGMLTPGTPNILNRVAVANVPFDFDGDSKTDISIFRPDRAEWWFLRSSDNGNNAVQFGQTTDKLVPADFTGDGKTDVAFWRETTGEWFILRSEDSSFYGFPFGTSGDIPTPADFDGDGIADAAVFRPSSGTWFISRSSDGGTDIIGFGISEDKPAVADYDGDGKADIAIYRPSNSQWWIFRSQDGLIALQFGMSGDKTVQGDYTGDGKADVAFWREVTGEWFVIRSEDDSFFGFPFGSNGDVPSPGDYDGDGTFDAAVFRPSNNTWYLRGSTSGTQIVGFGINNDVPLPSVFVSQ